MSCEHLICANCGGPVAEGQCAACRSARADLHRPAHGLSVPYVLAIFFLVITVILMLRHLAH